MVEYMLANVICDEFSRSVDKTQHVTGKSLHIGFGIRPSKSTDQYHVIHMYIYAPMNYVYVATQSERITAGGKRVVGPMKILCYHDSCWRDAIQRFIFDNRADLSVFNSFKLGGWNDVVILNEDEKTYLNNAEKWRSDNYKDEGPCPLPNPFDNRGIWAGKC